MKDVPYYWVPWEKMAPGPAPLDSWKRCMRIYIFDRKYTKEAIDPRAERKNPVGGEIFSLRGLYSLRKEELYEECRSFSLKFASSLYSPTLPLSTYQQGMIWNFPKDVRVNGRKMDIEIGSMTIKELYRSCQVSYPNSEDLKEWPARLLKVN